MKRRSSDIQRQHARQSYRPAAHAIKQLCPTGLTRYELAFRMRKYGVEQRAEAEVVVVRDPGDVGRMKRGAILVAPATDPSWTPLFTLASGVIVEVGGVLSHASTISSRTDFARPAIEAECLSPSSGPKSFTRGKAPAC